MIGHIRKFFQYNPLQGTILCFFFFLESLLEGIGISLIIPVFEILFGNDRPTDKFSLYLNKLYNLFEMEMTTSTVLVGLTLVFLLKSFVTYFAKWVVTNNASFFLKDIQYRLYDVLMNVDISYINTKKQGMLTNALTVEATRSAASFIYISQWISTLLSLILYAGFALYISPSLTTLACVIGVVSLLPLRVITKKVEKFGNETTKLNELIQSDLIEHFSSMKVIKAMTHENSLRNRFNSQVERYRQNWKNVFFYSNSVNIYSQPIVVGVLSLVLYIANAREIPFSEMVVFLLTIQRLLPAYTTMITLKNNIKTTIPGFDRIDALIEEASCFLERADGSEEISFEKGIQYEKVCFSYEENKLVIKDLSLRIGPNQTIAILGGSGAGKTTLIDLLLGYYSPQSGSILINDRRLDDLNLKAWRSQIAYVPQEPALFHDTVAANISWGHTNANKDEIIEACKKAAAHDFILTLEKSYDTIIGDRGLKLSGGQRQRLILARALLNKPSVLILDEATSALDFESETAIKKSIALLQNNRDMIIILIAHRLTTVREADKIFILEDGRVLEEGSWAELTSRKDGYLNKADLN